MEAEMHQDLGNDAITKSDRDGEGTVLFSRKGAVQEKNDSTTVSRPSSCTVDTLLTTDKKDNGSASSKLNSDDLHPDKKPSINEFPSAANVSRCKGKQKTFMDGGPREKDTDENGKHADAICAEYITQKVRSLKIEPGLLENDVSYINETSSQEKISTTESAKKDVDVNSKHSLNEHFSDAFRSQDKTDFEPKVTRNNLAFPVATKTGGMLQKTIERCNTAKNEISTDTSPDQTQTKVSAPSLTEESMSRGHTCTSVTIHAENGVTQNVLKDQLLATVTPHLPYQAGNKITTDQNARPQLHDDIPSLCESTEVSGQLIQTNPPPGEHSSLFHTNVTNNIENLACVGDTQATVTEFTPAVPDIVTLPGNNAGGVTFNTSNATNRGYAQSLIKPYRRQYQRWPIMAREQIPRYSWTPKIVRAHRRFKKPFYNTLRLRKYVKTSLNQDKLDNLIKFYDSKVQIDTNSEEATVSLVDDILEKILCNTYLTMRNQFAEEANDEGSVTSDTKVGIPDESDHSVEILLEDRDEIILSDEPFDIEYSEDDIDANVMDEIPSTAFVSGGKRLFPEESRPFESEEDPADIPDGLVALRFGLSDAVRFADCCISRDGVDEDCGWILPYQLLHTFHRGIGRSLETLDLDGVTLNNGARGPAVTLTVQQQLGPNISVDITPKLSLPADILNITHFKWPRNDTRKWLTKSKIKQVAEEAIYLVPKGDKYWKISFANLENELLDDIDDKGTWRKECLKIMKKKLIQWKSKSRAGLKGLSSYLLKTTLLWLCEILPADKYWTRDQLANRYLNFLQELEHRLKMKRLGEYFNPSVNLLEYKNTEDIEELRGFLLGEIEDFSERQEAVSAQ